VDLFWTDTDGRRHRMRRACPYQSKLQTRRWAEHLIKEELGPNASSITSLVVAVLIVPRRPSHELLADNVREIAQAKGVSFVFLASKVGISTERLLAIFSGQFDLLNKLAEGLGVGLADLFAEPIHD
jgi:hypothetical protein